MCKLLSVILLLLVLALLSCNNATDSSENIIRAVPNKPDTAKPIITTNFPGEVYPVIFQAAFDSSTQSIEDDIRFNFSRLDIGKIKIETGKIIAGDPVVLHDAIPFIQDFPVGEFPVQLAIAKTKNDERVAFSRIVFSDSAIIEWQFALTKGQTPISLGDSNFYCYGVDAGIGVFIDSVSNLALQQKEKDIWDEVFMMKTAQNGLNGYKLDFDGHNLTIFTTGWGDGCYATYIGFDKNGNICQLLTDFGLVPWWKYKIAK